MVGFAGRNSPGLRAKGDRHNRGAPRRRACVSAGELVPRSPPNALLANDGEACEQAISMVCDRRVRTSDGDLVATSAQTLCLHGDGSHAVALASQLRAALAKQGLWFYPPTVPVRRRRSQRHEAVRKSGRLPSARRVDRPDRSPRRFDRQGRRAWTSFEQLPNDQRRQEPFRQR